MRAVALNRVTARCSFLGGTMLVERYFGAGEMVEWNPRSGTTIPRQVASRANGAKGGRQRVYVREVGRSANAVRQQAYRDRHPHRARELETAAREKYLERLSAK
jgi:hypothetical protein